MWNKRVLQVLFCFQNTSILKLPEGQLCRMGMFSFSLFFPPFCCQWSMWKDCEKLASPLPHYVSARRPRTVILLSPCHLTLNATSPSSYLSIMLSHCLTGRIRAVHAEIWARVCVCVFVRLCSLHPWPTSFLSAVPEEVGSVSGNVCQCFTTTLSFMLGWFQTARRLSLSSPQSYSARSHCVVFSSLICGRQGRSSISTGRQQVRGSILDV